MTVLGNLLIDKLVTLGRVMGLEGLRDQIIESKLLTARVLINQMKSAGRLERIADAEFKVFSQFGDDGIIQYLVHVKFSLTKTHPLKIRLCGIS